MPYPLQIQEVKFIPFSTKPLDTRKNYFRMPRPLHAADPRGPEEELFSDAPPPPRCPEQRAAAACAADPRGPEVRIFLLC